ncbi:TIGR03619 family F420-dependent LLM class oxidoreductase [Frankia sp. QA3]|uniref:TIGR03619 family F420-dependent LLM class oxidoreductase n=1 Tax=Frankia sp. QA3 TaxID=710111 RepID=UPI000269BF42|nr:TIGR03619 family F420-dependent LLM class oxidoreductase [Frankia sp. QA3]EIV91932.1 putative F420-dependent oxidoreductase, Rv2161c family [Frankia sp. QA3]
MELNYQFPTRAVKHWERWIGERDLADVAVAAEESGFDIVSTTDHPFPSSAWISGGGHHSFDPFVSLAFMAAATRRVRLLTFILVAGYRNPYLTAKSTASLDLLSGGRLVVGMGAGYQKPEFDVLGAQFDGRGGRFDAAIAAMHAAWTGEVVERDDDPYFPASGHVMLPRPAQRPGPPIWIGGNSRAAMRRVAEVADGWLPFEQPAQMAEITTTPSLAADEIGERIATLRELRAAAGRPTAFDVCFTPQVSRDPARAAETLAAAVAGYEAAGVTHLSVESHARSIDDCLAEIELFGKALAPPAPAPTAPAP